MFVIYVYTYNISYLGEQVWFHATRWKKAVAARAAEGWQERKVVFYAYLKHLLTILPEINSWKHSRKIWHPCCFKIWRAFHLFYNWWSLITFQDSPSLLSSELYLFLCTVLFLALVVVQWHTTFVLASLWYIMSVR